MEVERAFRRWSTGEYILPPKLERTFSQSRWGYATNEVMESVDHLSPKQQKKILGEAEKYVGAHQYQCTLDVVVAQLRKRSGRAKCYEPDSD